MPPVCLLTSILGQEPELSEQWGCSQITLTCRCNSSLSISPGQKLHDGGSKSQVKNKDVKRDMSDIEHEVYTQTRPRISDTNERAVFHNRVSL